MSGSTVDADRSASRAASASVSDPGSGTRSRPPANTARPASTPSTTSTSATISTPATTGGVTTGGRLLPGTSVSTPPMSVGGPCGRLLRDLFRSGLGAGPLEESASDGRRIEAWLGVASPVL